MASCVDLDLTDGRSGEEYYERVQSLRVSVRARLAELIGAVPSSVALTRSTTDGCNIAVSGLGLSDRDEVVTTDVEHPALLGALHVCPARVRVAAIRDLPVDRALETIEALLTPRTRLVALSHVAWTTGAVLPIQQLTNRGFLVLVDGAQGAGAVPVDVLTLGCDFYTVSGQKWLLGPDATGALYVRSGLVSELSIPFPSYFSWKDEALTPREDALRFEPGWIPSASLAGLLESMSLAEQVGPDRFQRAQRMAEHCRGVLDSQAEVMTAPDQATLVSFRTGEAGSAVSRRLAKEGVVVRDLPGVDWIRASVGYWTSTEDIERLGNALTVR